MNIKELNRASGLIQEIGYFEYLIKSEKVAMRCTREDGDWCEYRVCPKGLESRGRIDKALNSICDELKAELKELGVDYE